MIFHCLCPTYGRPSLVANAAALFASQRIREGDRAYLLVLDDASQITPQTLTIDDQRTVIVFNEPEWMPLPTKYPRLVERSAGVPPADVYVIWDDDDVYLPWHLEGIAVALDMQQHRGWFDEQRQTWCDEWTPTGWTHPSRILSTYGTDPFSEPPRTEPAAGRFHGAAAVRVEHLNAGGGWCSDNRADYDQVHLARWRKIGAPGDPCLVAEPSYCYRWGDTGRWHCSGTIRDNVYAKPPIQEVGSVDALIPAYDSSTKAILTRLLPQY